MLSEAGTTDRSRSLAAESSSMSYSYTDEKDKVKKSIKSIEKNCRGAQRAGIGRKAFSRYVVPVLNKYSIFLLVENQYAYPLFHHLAEERRETADP